MLGPDQLQRHLNAGEITIRYGFDLTATDAPRLPENPAVDLANTTNAATRAFLTNLFGDRLAITLGPIVRSLRYTRHPRRHIFRGTPGVFDLTSKGEIDVQPNESLTVSSIEQITLGASTAALILPRLSLATVGVVVAPTYIDPHWNGILQLLLTNTNARPVTLKLGERIAICRFYGIVGGPIPDDLKLSFPQKSHHFGLNWDKIFDSDADPQPLRKQPARQPGLGSRLVMTLRTFSKWSQTIFGTAAGLLLVGLLIAWIDLRGELKRVENIERRALSMSAVAGDISLQIPPGTSSIQKLIPLRRPISPPKIAFAEVLESSRPVVLRYRIVAHPEEDRALLEIVLTRASSVQPHRSIDVSLKWIAAPVE